PSQGAFMSWLVRMIGAEKTIEVGVFTGGSTLITAQALPEHGRILACDVSQEWTDVAQKYWTKEGMDHKIQLILKPAKETPTKCNFAGEPNQYDFALIDADKESYEDYYVLCLRLIRRGDISRLDTMLWGDADANKSKQVLATRAPSQLKRRVLN